MITLTVTVTIPSFEEGNHIKLNAKFNDEKRQIDKTWFGSDCKSEDELHTNWIELSHVGLDRWMMAALCNTREEEKKYTSLYNNPLRYCAENVQITEDKVP